MHPHEGSHVSNVCAWNNFSACTNGYVNISLSEVFCFVMIIKWSLLFQMLNNRVGVGENSSYILVNLVPRIFDLMIHTGVVAWSSSLIWPLPNSCFSVAFVDAYNIFCRTAELSGDQLISNHSYPDVFLESSLLLCKIKE